MMNKDVWIYLKSERPFLNRNVVKKMTNTSAECYLKEKYNFSDVSVLIRQSNGTYINLSLLELSEIGIGRIWDYSGLIVKPNHIQSQYALSLFCTVRSVLCEVTLEELQLLANAKGTKFVNQVKARTGYDKSDKEGENILALILAKKILNYRWGKCQLVSLEDNEAVYAFVRNTGKNEYRTVLEKKFLIGA